MSDFLNELKIVNVNITLDPNFYNIITTNKLPDNIIETVRILADGKPINIYTIAKSSKIECIDGFFSVIDNLNITETFDLFVLYKINEYGKEIESSNKLKINILCNPYIDLSPFSRLQKITTIDDMDLMEYNYIYENTNKKEIKHSDIRMQDILPYCEQELPVYECLEHAVHKYISNTHVEIGLNSVKTNVLILCADDRTLHGIKSKRIIHSVLGDDIIFDDTDFYFTGANIAKNKCPFINRVLAQNLTVVSKTKFDLIVLEHCPFMILTDNLEKILPLLDLNGMIISPTYRFYEQDPRLKQIVFDSQKKYVGYMLN